MVLPTAIAIAPDAVPEFTATPFTFIVAVGSCAVGVTVTDVVPGATVVVYVVVLPLVPVLVNAEAGVSFIALSIALVEGAALVTVIE